MSSPSATSTTILLKRGSGLGSVLSSTRTSERIFELQPDLVITYGTQSNLHERLTAAGIRQHSFVSGSIDHVLEAIRVLGREIELEEEGNRLADEITQALEDIRSTAPEDRPRVFLTHSRTLGSMGSFYSGGTRSYFHELIEIAGGENIFGDVDDNAFQPSLEEVSETRPRSYPRACSFGSERKSTHPGTFGGLGATAIDTCRPERPHLRSFRRPLAAGGPSPPPGRPEHRRSHPGYDPRRAIDAACDQPSATSKTGR